MSAETGREALEAAIARLHTDARSAPSGEPWDRASVAACGDGLRVAYFGDPWAEGCDALFDTMARESVARWITSIELVGDDVGAESTCDWELDALTPRGASYPGLTTFRIARGSPFRATRVIVATPGRDRADGGALARLADAAPRLAILESPSAPDALFLVRRRDAIRVLEIDAGRDHAGFVLDLASRGGALPALERFAWGDDAWGEGWRARATPREDFIAFFRSQTFARLRHFTWRNPPFSDAEVDSLLRQAHGPKIRIERMELRRIR